MVGRQHKRLAGSMAKASKGENKSQICVQELMKDYAAVTTNKQHKRELQRQLEKWSKVVESAMQQKSRAQWLTLGDANTDYIGSKRT
ncbi:hypothetical protein H5410_051490 [Solanum commersonii]|uniref:Uncharacterized protein n=1 Tax=Solanum commersonii TaxID=4109 RepID=A0A9J5WZP0_SOLCO|nr:hypothetical protein H5410_051490 [Solanum commersonii]